MVKVMPFAVGQNMLLLSNLLVVLFMPQALQPVLLQLWQRNLV